MNCPTCGTSLENGVKFCYNCGTPMAADSSQASSEAESKQNPMNENFNSQQFNQADSRQYSNQNIQPYNTGDQQYGDQQYGNQQYGNRQYGNQQYGNQQYGNQQYGNQQYGNRQYGNQQYGNPNIPPYGYQQPMDNTGRRCKNCKTIFFEGDVCPACNSTDVNYKPDLWMGILALIFAVLGGWFGILFGILGIQSAKRTGYKPLKIMSIIAIPLCIVSIIIWSAITIGG